SESGLDALSVRRIAKRIEYSPGTIYLYFRDKDELIAAVVSEGFARLGEYMREELARASQAATPTDRLYAVSHAYMQFALENTAYFRVMFELPTDACVDCPQDSDSAMTGECPWDYVVAAAGAALSEGSLDVASAEEGAVLGWGPLHGLTSLYLGGHLGSCARTPDELWALIQGSLRRMFSQRETLAEERA
ncbi:MAG: TetR/AcrR family transcriptional regulator, partial [Longimicrobiales bacterium]